MPILHVLLRDHARTQTGGSPTTNLQAIMGEIVVTDDPDFGPVVSYKGSPWLVPMANVTCIERVPDPVPDVKPDPKAAKK